MIEPAADPREYHVEWTIEVHADSYESAARQAWAMVSNPESFAHTFEVTVHGRTGATPVVVDLDEIDERGMG